MSYKQKIFILQIALAFLFAKFGIEKLFFPESWVMFIPMWFTTYIKINVAQIILLCGALEVGLAIWLLIPWKTHMAAYAACLYFLPIISVTGISHAGTRDIALLICAFALALLSTPPKIDLHFTR